MEDLVWWPCLWWLWWSRIRYPCWKLAQVIRFCLALHTPGMTFCWSMLAVGLGECPMAPCRLNDGVGGRCHLRKVVMMLCMVLPLGLWWLWRPWSWWLFWGLHLHWYRLRLSVLRRFGCLSWCLCSLYVGSGRCPTLVLMLKCLVLCWVHPTQRGYVAKQCMWQSSCRMVVFGLWVRRVSVPKRCSPPSPFSGNQRRWTACQCQWLPCHNLSSVLLRPTCCLRGLRQRDAQSASKWWFGPFFIFPYIGTNNPNWRIHIFQRGRLNHQPVYWWKDQGKNSLVGGFNHFLFSIIYGIILPID